MGRGTYIRANRKRNTGDFRSLSIYDLTQTGQSSFSWSRGGTVIAQISIFVAPESCVFGYTTTDRLGNKRVVDQTIFIDRTPCHYGGQRKWFLCRCGRRVTRLFLTSAVVACRHCLNLNYSSQIESPLDNLWRRRDKVLDKLGGDVNRTHIKPKHMQSRTWARLHYEYNHAMIQALGGAIQGIEKAQRLWPAPGRRSS